VGPGWHAIDPLTRAPAPNRTEYDVTFDYRPAWSYPAFLKGLWFRARVAVVDQDHAPRAG